MLTIEELKELCDLTVRLTVLRQNECKHLAIENFGPRLLAHLVDEYLSLRVKPLK